MAYKVELTHRWDIHRMQPCYASIRYCLKRFADEFPEETTEDFLWEQICTGQRLMWAAYEESDPNKVLLVAVTVDQINEATKRKVVECVAMGGDHLREVLKPVVKAVEEWAKEHGCDGARVIGRFGWIPVMKEFGYRKKAVILEKWFNDEGALESAA